jgi:hypothetical protein
MGSSSSSRQESSTSSNVNQDIFGISDIASGANAAGGNISTTDILDYSTSIEDNSDRSVNNSGNTMIEGARNRTYNTTSIDARDMSDNSTRVLNNISTSDPEIMLGALDAVEDVAGSSIAAQSAVSLSALSANNKVTSRALRAVEESSARSAKTVERGLDKVSGSLQDFGSLTLALAKEDAKQTGDLLKAGQDQVASVIKANKTETAQGFENLTETIVLVAGIGAAAAVLGAS